MFIERRLKKRFEEDSYSDSAVLTFHHAWEGGWFGEPRQGDPPFSARRVRLAEKRRKRAQEEDERKRWERKIKATAERKKAREEKAQAEKKSGETKQ
ncbi:MAG TPA: hypothetical protein VK508_07725 [Cyclobacteriaceae bacterium]|nr:hypothetical protein [Cyclobacteriaceae bacterium]